MNDIIKTLQFEKEQLEARIRLLEDKIESDNRQISDEYIRLDTTIIAIDRLINEAATGTMARTLFKAKDTLYSQQKYAIDVQPVKRGRWENEYLDDDVWWADCTNCKNDTNSRFGRVSSYAFCPNCGARMIKDGDTECHDTK